MINRLITVSFAPQPHKVSLYFCNYKFASFKEAKTALVFYVDIGDDLARAHLIFQNAQPASEKFASMSKAA